MDIVFAIIALITCGIADGRPPTFNLIEPMEPRDHHILAFRPKFESAMYWVHREAIMGRKISTSSPLNCLYAVGSRGHVVRCEDKIRRIKLNDLNAMAPKFHLIIKELRYYCKYFFHRYSLDII